MMKISKKTQRKKQNYNDSDISWRPPNGGRDKQQNKNYPTTRGRG